MEENKQGYDPSEFEDDDYMTPQPDAGKSIRGYRIVIIILSVILVALSALYFSIHRQQMIDNRLLQSDRDSQVAAHVQDTSTLIEQIYTVNHFLTKNIHAPIKA